MTEPPRPPGDDPTASGNPQPADGPTPPPYSPPPPYTPPPPGPGGFAPGPGGPAGGYPPPGYGTPQYGYGAPTPFTNDEDRTWVIVAHFGGAALAFISSGWLGWLAPLVALLVRGNQSPAVRAHAVRALNFQLLWAVVALIITVVSTCLSVIVIGLAGFVLLILPWAMGTVCGIVAGVRALNGEPYTYPATPNWVK